MAGAIYSGLGMVLTLIIPLRRALRIEHMITEYHFDNLAKLTLLTGSILFYAYAMEYFIAWYSGNTFEQTTFFRRAFGPHLVGRLDDDHLQRLRLAAALVPEDPDQPHVALRHLDLHQHRDVVRALRDHRLVAQQRLHPLGLGELNPTWADWGILVGSFGWFGMWFLLFAKSFPIVAIQEIKEMIPMPRKRRGRAPLMAAAQAGRRTPGVLASFVHVDAAADAIRALRARGHRNLVVYSRGAQPRDRGGARSRR